jgi:hypothetical protein
MVWRRDDEIFSSDFLLSPWSSLCETHCPEREGGLAYLVSARLIVLKREGGFAYLVSARPIVPRQRKKLNACLLISALFSNS